MSSVSCLTKFKIKTFCKVTFAQLYLHDTLYGKYLYVPWSIFFTFDPPCFISVELTSWIVLHSTSTVPLLQTSIHIEKYLYKKPLTVSNFWQISPIWFYDGGLSLTELERTISYCFFPCYYARRLHLPYISDVITSRGWQNGRVIWSVETPQNKSVMYEDVFFILKHEGHKSKLCFYLALKITFLE